MLHHQLLFNTSNFVSFFENFKIKNIYFYLVQTHLHQFLLKVSMIGLKCKFLVRNEFVFFLEKTFCIKKNFLISFINSLTKSKIQRLAFRLFRNFFFVGFAGGFRIILINYLLFLNLFQNLEFFSSFSNFWK